MLTQLIGRWADWQDWAEEQVDKLLTWAEATGLGEALLGLLE